MLRFRANQLAAKEPPPEAHQGPSEAEAKTSGSRSSTREGSKRRRTRQHRQQLTNRKTSPKRRLNRPIRTNSAWKYTLTMLGSRIPKPDDTQSLSIQRARLAKSCGRALARFMPGSPIQQNQAWCAYGGIIDGKGVQREPEAIVLSTGAQIWPTNLRMPLRGLRMSSSTRMIEA